MQTGLAQTERVPTALESFISNFSCQLERMARNNHRMKAVNDKFLFEPLPPSNGAKSDSKPQEGLLPSLEQYSQMFIQLLDEQEINIEKIERFV